MGIATENRENGISAFYAIYTRTAKIESESRLLDVVLSSSESLRNAIYSLSENLKLLGKKLYAVS